MTETTIKKYIPFGEPIKPETAQGGFGFIPNGIREKNIFFYHPDHLGSSSYITGQDGKVSQHTEYIAFGEILFDEHNTEHTMPYLFNGKELDQETGLYYYGARYLDSKTSLWLNVDPLAEKYPNISPYAYVANNPIKYIDPDGRRIIVPQQADRTKVISYLNRIYGKDNFSFNEKGILEFVGNTKDMNRKQIKSLKLMKKAIDIDYDINIKLSNFTNDENQLIEKKSNAVATEGGAISLIYTNENHKIVKASILMDPQNLTDIPLYNETYIYQDTNGNLVTGAQSCPDGTKCGKAHEVIFQNKKVMTAPKSAEATLIHEIAHTIYEGRNQKNVIKEENTVREILNIPQRSSSDPEHN